jgi:hypothetical protein
MIAATFHGPNHSPNHDESSIEVFDNIGHALAALFERYDANGRRHLPVRFLNGNHGDIIFPVVTEGHYFECYRIDSLDNSVPPGDEVIEDALTAVHVGVPDYTLTLTPDAIGGIAIMVQKG